MRNFLVNSSGLSNNNPITFTSQFLDMTSISFPTTSTFTLQVCHIHQVSYFVKATVPLARYNGVTPQFNRIAQNQITASASVTLSATSARINATFLVNTN